MTASALQAVGFQGACYPSSTHSVAGAERVSLRVSSSVLKSRKAGSCPSLKLKKHHTASRGFHLGKSCRSSRSRRLEACHALSLHTVTADNASENGEAAGPSMRSIDFASQWQGRDDLRQFLTVTKHSLQESFTIVKERGLVQSTKDLLLETKERAGRLDVKKVVSQVEHAGIGAEAGRIWQSSQPWVKWPLAIFSFLYLLVTLCFGPAVSTDLLPGWILGPLVTGLLIRASLQAYDFVSGCLRRLSPYSQAAAEVAVQLYQDARSGTLPSKVTVYSQARLKELRDRVEAKKSGLKLYVTSGQAGSDSKAYVKSKSGDLIEWSTIKYEDFTDWIRPYWRAVCRFFQKIF